MESIEYLSEVLIETLKEFSTQKRALTPEALSGALSAKKGISSLLSGVGPGGFPNNEEVSCARAEGELKRAPLQSERSSENNPSCFPQLRDIFLNILDGLGPITRDEFIQRSSELQQRINDCQSIEALAAQGEDIVCVARLLAGRAIEEIDYAGDFLAELSKDLSGMEKELFTYQDFNRETHLLNDTFRDNLLSHTEEMSHAIDSDKGLEDAKSLIASKLTMIGKAIETKRQEDESRLREADTKIAELQMSVRNHNEEIIKVTERANTLEKEVLLDALTEIHNRRAYELQMRESLRRYHREGQPFSLILMDVDRFKNINDKYGHSAGDRCLKEIAKIIRSSLRKTDFLARYGGEEIVAILPGSSADDARKIAEKVRSRIELARFSYQQEEIPVTISLGVTEARPADQESDAAFMRVDTAMYQAKKEGRNRVCAI